jgi:hypothetical protein
MYLQTRKLHKVMHLKSNPNYNGIGDTMQQDKRVAFT